MYLDRVRNENPESNGHSLSSVSVSQKTNEIKMPTFTDKVIVILFSTRKLTRNPGWEIIKRTRKKRNSD